MQLYQVEMGSIRASLEVTNGRVTAAVPVLVHSVGLPWEKVREWVKMKGGRIEMLSDSKWLSRVPGQKTL